MAARAGWSKTMNTLSRSKTGQVIRRLITNRSVRNLAIALVLIALSVAYVVVAMDYMKQLRVRETTTLEVSDVARNLNQVPPPPQDLQQRLAAAQARLATAPSSFPGKPNSTQVINKILRLADECQVKAIPITIASSL